MKNKSKAYERSVAAMGGAMTSLIFGMYVLALYVGSHFIEQ